MWQGIDQRRFPRANYECTVNMSQEGVPFAISAVTENVGLGGICVLLDKGFDVFSAVSLELELKDGQSPLRVQGTVVWVVRRRELKKGYRFDTGIEFAELSPEDKARLEALMVKLVPGK